MSLERFVLESAARSWYLDAEGSKTDEEVGRKEGIWEG